MLNTHTSQTVLCQLALPSMLRFAKQRKNEIRNRKVRKKNRPCMDSVRGDDQDAQVSGHVSERVQPGYE